MAYKRPAPEYDQYDPRGPPQKKAYDPYADQLDRQQPPPQQYSQPPPQPYGAPPPQTYAPDPYAQYQPAQYPPQQYAPAAPAPTYAQPQYYSPYGAQPQPAYAGYPPPATYAAPRQPGGDRCRHFARGFCKLGDTCNFSHTGSAGDMNRCRHFAIKGFCKMGDGCGFSHEGTPGDMTLEQFIAAGGSANPNGMLGAVPYQQNNASTFNGGFGIAAGSTPSGPVGPQILSGGGRGSTPCRHFQRGFCRLGDKCGFAHEGKAETASTPPASDGAGPSAEVVEKAKAAAENAAKAISAALEKKNEASTE